MALIIKCKGCGARLKTDDPCPGCGSAQRTYIVDYWPDGRYGKRARYPLPDYVQDKDAAEAYEKDIRETTRFKSKVPAPDRGTTIDELLDEYLKWCRLHQMKSTCDEKEYTTRHISRILGQVAVMSFNDSHVGLYQKMRKAQGVSNKTINKEVYYAMSILRWCRDEKKMDVPEVKFKKLKYNRPIPIVLSPDEAIRIIDAASPFYRAFFLCLYSLGLRFSEAQQLAWDNIDFENKTIVTIQKGGSYKILPLNELLESALKMLKPEKNRKGYIFVSRQTGNPVVNIRKPLAAAVEKAKIKKRVHPHLFRHSFSTHLMGLGVNMRIIQQMLGHADIGTTEWYSHVVTDHMKSATKDFFDRMSTASRRPAKATSGRVYKKLQKLNKIKRG